MKRMTFMFSILSVVCILGLFPTIILGQQDVSKASLLAMQVATFTENKGQIQTVRGLPAKDVLFHSRTKGMKVFIRQGGISYQFEQSSHSTPKNRAESMISGSSEIEPGKYTAHRIDLNLLNANPSAKVITESPTKALTHYYGVKKGSSGLHNLQSYGKVTFQNIYPLIDWVIYTTEKGIKYDFIVHPGGKVSDIQMTYRFADAVTLSQEGNIEVKSSIGKLTEFAPVCEQGGKIVDSKFDFRNNIIRFAVSGYDTTRMLRIDPEVVWASYFGNNLEELCFDICRDAMGDLIIAGYTFNVIDFIPGGIYNSTTPLMNAYLAKFNADGVLIWSAWYSNLNGNTLFNTLTSDLQGNLYAAGYAGSNQNVYNGHQTIWGGKMDGLVLKTNSQGILEWSSFYGGSENDEITSITLDGESNVICGGYTKSTTGIGSNGWQNQLQGEQDAFIVKFNSQGQRFWGSYYGSESNETGNGIVADHENNIYLTGRTQSINGLLPSFSSTTTQDFDAFLLKVNEQGVPQWLRHDGGPDSDGYTGISLDANQNILVCGSFKSVNLTVTIPTTNVINNATGYVICYDTDGNKIWNRYYGGNGLDDIKKIVVNSTGDIYISGQTSSTQGIAFNGFLNDFQGILDGFVSKLTSEGVMVWGSYFGGSNYDWLLGLEVDDQNIYISGHSYSSTGISTPGSHQSNFGGIVDAYIAKIKIASIQPNQAPVARCQDRTISANENCVSNVPGYRVDMGSTDPDNDPLTFTLSPAGPYPIGTTEVVMTADDGNGNQSTCTANITVVFNISDEDRNRLANIPLPSLPISITQFGYETRWSNIEWEGAGSNKMITWPGAEVKLKGQWQSRRIGTRLFGIVCRPISTCFVIHSLYLGDTNQKIHSHTINLPRVRNNGNVNASFSAPSTPGLYYVVQHPKCSCKSDKARSRANPKLAIAVLWVKECALPRNSEGRGE
jgi:hypothetical protein